MIRNMAATPPPRRRLELLVVLACAGVLEIAGAQNNATVDPSEDNEKKKRIVGVVAVASLVSLFAICFYYMFQRIRKRHNNFKYQELLRINAPPPYIFSYSELRAATNDFNPANKLGEGTFGPVYKGKLGRSICVKQLSVAPLQGKAEFLAEVATMSDVRHRNVAILYGCCIHEDKRLLVYQYNDYTRSLHQVLFGSKRENLDCTTRYMVCLGVANGLRCIHYEARPHVHGDVKATNIFLNSYFTPQIFDFGVAKLYDHNMTHKTTRIAGTMGYLAQEYEMFGHVTEKADIFSFGVLALEIISGKRNTDDGMYLLQWAWNVYENNKELELDWVNGSLNDARTVRQIIGVALSCTQASPSLRPAMSRVFDMLSGEIKVPIVTSKPAYLTDEYQYPIQ